MTEKLICKRMRATWRAFAKSSDEELNELLEEAGVVPGETRSEKLGQCLIVWYHGNIPNRAELHRICRIHECLTALGFNI